MASAAVNDLDWFISHLERTFGVLSSNYFLLTFALC